MKIWLACRLIRQDMDGLKVIDAYRSCLPAPVELAQGADHLASCLVFLLGGHGVLQIQKDQAGLAGSRALAIMRSLEPGVEVRRGAAAW